MLAEFLKSTALYVQQYPKTSVGFLLLGAIVYHAIIYPLFLSPLRKVPGPYIYRITKLFALNGQRTQKWISTVHTLHQKYGPIVLLAPNEISVDADYKFVQDIYVRNFPKSPFYQNFKNHGSRDNMFSELTNEKHLEYRKLLLPLYQKSAVFSTNNSTRYVLCDKVQKLVSQIHRSSVTGEEPDYINEKSQHNEYGKGHNKQIRWLDTSQKTNLGIEVYSLFGSLAMDVVSAFELGKQNGTDLLSHPEDRHILVSHRLQASMGFWTTLAPQFWNWAATEKILNASAVIEKWQLALYANAEANAHKTYHNGNITSLEQLKRNNLFGKDAYSFLSDNIFAGHETTAIQLTYLTYELSRPVNLGIQQRLIEELEANFGKPSSHQDIIEDLEAVDKLPFVEALFQENLRLHASIPGAEPRVVHKPYKIQLSQKDSVVVPVGTTISCQPYSIQRNDKVFPDPERFIVDRWLQQEGESEKDFKQRLTIQQRYMMPFGKGIRMCLGMNLAMIEMKLAIANIYWHYHSRLSPDWCQVTTAEDAKPIKLGEWNQGRNITDEEKMCMVDSYTTRPLNDECWLRWYVNK